MVLRGLYRGMLKPVAPSTERETVVLDDESATILDGAPTSLAPSDASLPPGTRLGRYEILEELGRGGMGVVYRAHDSALDREIALKRLHGQHLGQRARDRLAREAQAMARLSHPHVVTVYDVSTEDDELLVAMEYVRGPTLREWLETSRPWSEVLHVLLEAGLGLAQAHERGLVHRDFKPGNVILGADGRTRVLDFGIAVIGDEPSTLDTTGDGVLDDSARGAPSTLTATGAVMGTPAYMAPEQHSSRTSDPRVDQFAFCVSLWEGLVGSRPYDGSYTEVIAAKFKGPPPWPDDSPVPRRIVSALRRGLATSPSERWPDMSELLRALQPRRRRWPKALGAGVGAIAIGALTWTLAEPTPCEQSEDPLAGIWDDQHAQQAEHALQTSAVAYAHDAWPGVRRALDDYAVAWAQQRAAACQATHVDQTQSSAVLDLRMACLERYRQALGATVEALGIVGPDDVRSILQEVADLPSPDRCSNVEALQTELAPPSDPEVAARVQAIRIELPRAHAWLQARDYDSVQDAVDRLTTTADATGYEPVQLEVELLAGRLELARGDIESGQIRLTAAYEQASALGHDRAAVEAAARLAVGAALYQARIREGLQWAETAVAVAERLGSGGEEDALAHDTLGRVLRVSGNYEAAIKAHRRALEIRERLHGSERLLTVLTRHRLGYALTVAKRPEEALEQLDRVQQDLEHALGPNHPEVAAILLTRALALVDQGGYDEAEAAYLRALHINDSTLAPDDPTLANVPMMLGNLYMMREEPAQALPHHERALRIRETAYGSEDSRVALTLGMIAADQHKLGRLDEAERLYRRALRIRQAALDDNHPGIASSFNNLATVLTAQGKLDEAGRSLVESIERYERAVGPDSSSLASPLTNLGRLRRTQGNAAEAESLHRRALRMRLAIHGEVHLDVASVQHNLAGALLDQGHHEEAAQLYGTVLSTMETIMGPEHQSMADPLRGLGHAQVELLRFDEARRTLELARTLLVAGGESEGSEDLVAIDQLLARAKGPRGTTSQQ